MSSTFYNYDLYCQGFKVDLILYHILVVMQYFIIVFLKRDLERSSLYVF